MSVIYTVASMVRQREYQNARALGFSFGAAIDMSWLAYNDVLAIGRNSILERK